MLCGYNKQLMKKALAAVFIVALVSAGIFFAVFRGWFWRPLGERLFPEDTIVYVSLDNIERARKNLENTTVWKQLRNSPRKDIHQKLIQRAFSSFESASGFDLRPVLDQFNGEVSIGFFPLSEGEGSAGLVAKVREDSKFGEFLEQHIDPALKRRFPEIKKSQYTYEGTSYYKYSSTRFPREASPCYYISGHHFVFTINENGMRHLLEVDKGKFKTLRESEVFRTARKQSGYRRGLLAFVNVPAGLGLAEKNIPATASRYWSGMLKLTGIQAVRGFVYTTRVEGGAVEESGFVEVNRERSGFTKIYMEQPPRKMESLQYIPSSVKMVSASTLPDFIKAWDGLNAQLGTILDKNQYQQYQQGLALLRGILNFDIKRDLMETVGDEIALSYEPGSSKAPLNLNFLLVLNLKNPDTFRITVSRVAAMAAARGIAKQEVNYKNRTLQVFNLSLPNAPLSPSYSFDGKWFLFASNQNLLQAAFDGKDSGDGIQSTPDYKKSTSGFPSKTHALSYTNVSAYLKSQAVILKNRANEENAYWIREYELDQELLDLSKVLSGNATYTKIEKDGIRIHGNSSVPSVFLGFTGVIEYLPELIKKYARTPEL
jgi:Protein of unknown function (DUF3352)